MTGFIAAPLACKPCFRANDVGVIMRMVNTLFGAPSFLRANGLPECGRKGQKKARLLGARTRDVYQIDRRGTCMAESLPRIWLSETVDEVEVVQPEEVSEPLRRFKTSYPVGADKGGVRALELGEMYFSEGMAHQEDADVSLGCFQAAEILYLHAIERGSVSALARLGVLYRHDLCKGTYWRETLAAHARHAKDAVYEKAVRCFSRAAARGCAEAKWQLGDMMRCGLGCPVNEALALRLYRGSFCRSAGCRLREVECAQTCDEVLACVRGETSDVAQAGRAALRIAGCLQQGCGCASRAEAALGWYNAAALLLDSCVSDGLWYYTEELEAATEALRVLQDDISCSNAA